MTVFEFLCQIPMLKGNVHAESIHMKGKNSKVKNGTQERKARTTVNNCSYTNN